jgi:hypothetical protein
LRGRLLRGDRGACGGERGDERGNAKGERGCFEYRASVRLHA